MSGRPAGASLIKARTHGGRSPWVAGHVQLPLKIKQDVEQPCAVMLQQLLLHDEHVEVVAVGLGHIHVIGGQILRAFARNDGAGRREIPLAVGGIYWV